MWLDGRETAKRLRAEVADKIKPLPRAPRLAVVRVGHDPASLVYIGHKAKACQEVGIAFEEHVLEEQASQQQVLELLATLNGRSDVHGVLVQLPLPRFFDVSLIQMAIDPDKDVDGVHPLNLGRLVAGAPGLMPCTPGGIAYLLEAYDIPVKGREAVVVGRSLIVGKPMAALLTNADATVTICHSKTVDLAHHTYHADILVAAAGQPELIQPHMVRPGAVVIDVGIHRSEEGKLVGDVDPAVAEVAGYLTPVPGGVGPMTVAMLMANVLVAYEIQSNY